MIRVNVLGPLVIESNPASRGKLPKKGMALLALLAVHQGPVGRDRLADLLWPYQQSEQARHSLRNCLLEVRKRFDGDVVTSDFTTCRLNANSDIDRFQALAAAEDIDELQAFGELYRGDLLDGLDIAGDAWDEWLGPERQRLRDVAMSGLFRLGKLASAEGDHKTAIATAKRVIHFEPFCEVAHRLLMHALATAGRSAEALRHYEVMAELLKRELDIGPDGETRKLRDTIRRNVAPGPVAVELPPTPPPAEPSEAPADLLLPLQTVALTERSYEDLETLAGQLQGIASAALRIKRAIEALLEQHRSPERLAAAPPAFARAGSRQAA